MSAHPAGSTSGGKQDDGITEELYVVEKSGFLLCGKFWLARVERQSRNRSGSINAPSPRSDDKRTALLFILV